MHVTCAGAKDSSAFQTPQDSSGSNSVTSSNSKTQDQQEMDDVELDMMMSDPLSEHRSLTSPRDVVSPFSPRALRAISPAFRSSGNLHGSSRSLEALPEDAQLNLSGSSKSQNNLSGLAHRSAHQRSKSTTHLSDLSAKVRYTQHTLDACAFSDEAPCIPHTRLSGMATQADSTSL